MNNIFTDLPQNIDEEIFEIIASSQTVKIERIISKGHASLKTAWYDQEQNEWVIVLKGDAILEFENEQPVRLTEGDYINIPAHQKHRVDWTNPKQETIWLAVFY